jgi:hypothetical protein
MIASIIGLFIVFGAPATHATNHRSSLGAIAVAPAVDLLLNGSPDGRNRTAPGQGKDGRVLPPVFDLRLDPGSRRLQIARPPCGKTQQGVALANDGIPSWRAV